MDEKETTMAGKDLLLGAVAAGFLLSGYAAPAFAAKDRHGPRDSRMIERLDADKDGKVSLAEFKAGVSAAFKAFDADGNGAVTKEEIEARRTAFRDAHKSLRNAADADKAKAREALAASGPFMLPGAGRMFDRVDTDKSGTLSEAEVLASAEKIFAQRDRNKDAVLDIADAGPRKGHGKHHGDRAERGERMIERLDANKDGKVSQDEVLQRASATFEQLDADKDGTVTKAELDASREAFREARKALRAVKADDGEARQAARQAMSDARIGPMAGRMFHRADTDKNGALTKAEMEASVAEMFKQRDKNGDGFLTVDEIGKGRGR